MLKNNKIKGSRLRVGVFCGLGLSVLSGCTREEVITVPIGGKDYKINHTYSGGSSIPFGDVESYTINVDGKLYTCGTKEECIVNAETQLGKKRDLLVVSEVQRTREPSTEVPPLLERPDPPEDDGVPELLRKPKETSFGE